MNHNAARRTLEKFVNEWADPSARDSMHADLVALLATHGITTAVVNDTPPTCEYCARGIPRELHQFIGRIFATWGHYDLGDWVECTA